MHETGMAILFCPTRATRRNGFRSAHRPPYLRRSRSFSPVCRLAFIEKHGAPRQPQHVQNQGHSAIAHDGCPGVNAQPFHFFTQAASQQFPRYR
jgi:hypothetical protein